MNHLISNWKDGWKFWSTRLQVFGLMLLGLINEFPEVLTSMWFALPQDLKTMLPEDFGRYVVYAILLSGVVARFIRQRDLSTTSTVNENE